MYIHPLVIIKELILVVAITFLFDYILLFLLASLGIRMDLIYLRMCSELGMMVALIFAGWRIASSTEIDWQFNTIVLACICSLYQATYLSLESFEFKLIFLFPIWSWLGSRLYVLREGEQLLEKSSEIQDDTDESTDNKNVS